MWKNEGKRRKKKKKEEKEKRERGRDRKSYCVIFLCFLTPTNSNFRRWRHRLARARGVLAVSAAASKKRGAWGVGQLSVAINRIHQGGRTAHKQQQKF